MLRLATLETILLVIEVSLSVSAVVCFLSISIGDYRMQAWRYGGSQGWNSDPKERIYGHANFKAPPPIPSIWTDELSNSTLAISIVSLVSICVCHLCMWLKYMGRRIELLYYVLLVSLWILTLVQQSSGDSADEEHANSYPWFLTHSCADIWSQAKGSCQALQAGFYISLMIACASTARILATIFGMWQEWTSRRSGCKGSCHETPEVAEETDRFIPLQDNDDLGKIHQQAMSPVLAFFPEDHR